ncbi:putative Nuclear localization sequence-binding protein [Blattamonas nauphoetae]|uniref:Nuclear localization sequence-binding protein n=1 Tax=Blattamonas nauphoetae TaxID=2049346 RepID=A0ABQ9Y6H4_9EUKA|nr:putative Nuclear localization sequence-binding protein [Blattamonas nauphoetae]
MGKGRTPKYSQIAKGQSKKAHKTEKRPKKEESEDSSSDDSSSDSSTPPPPKNTHTPKKRETATKPSKSSKSSKKPKKEGSSDSSSFDSLNPPSSKTASLYISNLASQADPTRLKRAFLPHRPVSCRIYFDDNRTPLEVFSIMDFETPEQAELAKYAMQNHELDGRNIKINFLLRRPSGGFGYSLHVIPDTVTKPFKSSKKSKKEESSDSSSSDSSSPDTSSSDSSSSSSDKKSKSSSDSSSSDSDSSSSSSSKKAKSDSDSSDSSSDSSSSESSSSSSKATPTVFIGSLSSSSTEESLVHAFSRYGCSQAHIITDRQTGKSKSCGYLEFETQDGANRAVEEMNNASVDGRNVRLDVSGNSPSRNQPVTFRERTPYQNQRYQGQPDTKETKTLFIGNLSFQTNEDSIYDAFEYYKPLNCRVAIDHESGRSKGFGYVDFESHEQAEKAKNEMTDFELDGRNIRIDYSLPRQPREGGFTARGNRGRGDRGGFTPRGSRGIPRRGVGGTATKMTFD